MFYLLARIAPGRQIQSRIHRDSSEMKHLSEPLHCLIRTDSRYKLDMAKQMVAKIINQAIEGNDETKIQQLRDLAVINGTLRGDEGNKRRQLCDASSSRQPTAVTEKRTVHDADFEKGIQVTAV